jgi:hypothetical protein
MLTVIAMLSLELLLINLKIQEYERVKEKASVCVRVVVYVRANESLFTCGRISFANCFSDISNIQISSLEFLTNTFNRTYNQTM